MKNHKSCKIAFLAFQRFFFTFQSFENNDRRIKRAVEEENLKKEFTIE
jgi:hypothetical protein